MNRLLSTRRLTDIASHAYIWLLLLLFVMPFAALVNYSLTGPRGEFALQNFAYVFGSFTENLGWSFRISLLTLLINLAISLPPTAWCVTTTQVSTYCSRSYRYRCMCPLLCSASRSC